jgi:hypothetical protein
MGGEKRDNQVLATALACVSLSILEPACGAGRAGSKSPETVAGTWRSGCWQVSEARWTREIVTLGPDGRFFDEMPFYSDDRCSSHQATYELRGTYVVRGPSFAVSGASDLDLNFLTCTLPIDTHLCPPLGPYYSLYRRDQNVIFFGTHKARPDRDGHSLEAREMELQAEGYVKVE